MESTTAFAIFFIVDHVLRVGLAATTLQPSEKGSRLFAVACVHSLCMSSFQARNAAVSGYIVGLILQVFFLSNSEARREQVRVLVSQYEYVVVIQTSNFASCPKCIPKGNINRTLRIYQAGACAPTPRADQTDPLSSGLGFYAGNSVSCWRLTHVDLA
jgi:hypothetical protein